MKLTHDDHSEDTAREYERAEVMRGEVVHDDVRLTPAVFWLIAVVVCVLIVLIGVLMLSGAMTRLLGS